MQCTACSKIIQGEFAFCPHCGNKITKGCSNCGKMMMPEWINCPYCGSPAVKGTAVAYTPQNNQYPPPAYNNQNYHSAHNPNYHSDSSGQHHKRKKGVLGSFFSS